jgi:transcriptional regulator with XRE-family HTH domain
MSQACPRHIFSDRVQSLREKSGLSVQELATRAEVTARTIRRIERGTRQPSLTTAARIARALGADLNFLAGLYDERALAPTGAGEVQEGRADDAGCPRV